MEILGRINPDSIKIICTLSAVDFTEQAGKEIESLYGSDSLPMKIEGTEEGTTFFQTEQYPCEKLREALEIEYVNTNAPSYSLKELENMIFVCQSMYILMKGAIEELENAPLEINVDLDTWWC